VSTSLTDSERKLESEKHTHPPVIIFASAYKEERLVVRQTAINHFACRGQRKNTHKRFRFNSSAYRLK